MNPSTDPIPFSRPVLGPEEEAAVIDVLRSGWLTTGKVAAAFEAEFAAFCDVPHALAVNSATAGLHLALEALGVGPGDLCAVPDYTFTATAEVVRYLGADVMFVDSQPGSPNMDPQRLEDLLKRHRIKAVLPVHMFGEPVCWNDFVTLRDRYGFYLVEDAAHVFPAALPEGICGTLGDIGVFSFYANKNITTGEGGMIVTRNQGWSQRMRTMRLHGIDRDAFERFTSKAASWEYAIVAPGFKYNMTDIAAAIGREQLKKAKGFWEARRRIARLYDEGFKNLETTERPLFVDDHAWHVYAVQLRTERLRSTRNDVLQTLVERGIGTSVHYIPLHKMPYWKDRYGLEEKDFPNAQRRFERTISLPLYPNLTDDQVDRVIRTVREVTENLSRTAVDAHV